MAPHPRTTPPRTPATDDPARRTCGPGDDLGGRVGWAAAMRRGRRLRAMNRLASETSPYLRQHADNPVDWYPWGAEAFDGPRAEDRPVFLSVGYSACHWCHVMAHESFETQPTAELLNERFVAIKVDREERPDVDAVYMEAVQAMTGSGGWPMTRLPAHPTVVPSSVAPISPRATVTACRLPPRPRSRRRGVAQPARRGRPAGRRAGRRHRTAHPTARRPHRRRPRHGTARPRPRSDRAVRRGTAELAGSLRRDLGRLRAAPKFPQAQLVELCLRHHRRTGEPASLAMADDDAGGDGRRRDLRPRGRRLRPVLDRRHVDVPHFEKMLYDQAALVRVFLHAWQVTGRGAVVAGGRRDRRLRAP